MASPCCDREKLQSLSQHNLLFAAEVCGSCTGQVRQDQERCWGPGAGGFADHGHKLDAGLTAELVGVEVSAFHICVVHRACQSFLAGLLEVVLSLGSRKGKVECGRTFVEPACRRQQGVGGWGLRLRGWQAAAGQLSPAPGRSQRSWPV
eukprot:TRINITY_DN19100_c1_g1_i4.p2 TRINITY_DN19100_c1_g1~~TRINITY_DN19100_c1_g1_i4.p2  ORF type:complete len:149 (-),score=24.04 TRINITY_DN19100_c1_g1_i4:877-1323(-)